ncbi:uncharacterized protein LOC130420019 isoform X2 [Triplophysa dalaica]|uniref:uncharacterized protein LOC130420019 isoform X2 n=1 Tax=Triplophysa dalaica TaxID=1582913 RepID=UPI0024DF6DC5|nr:uncharacterized protein LOC130420019 isoform X2 [Triplophysa dalaica]
MAAASSNEFQFTVPETAQNVEVTLRSDVTVPCHLSPEKSAVNMEIKCVCVCKTRQVTEGRSYKGKANLVVHEGNVSLSLKDFKEMGDYLCQVISQDTTVEVTVQVNEYSDVQPVNQPPTFQSYPLTKHEENKLQEKYPRMRIYEKRPPNDTVQEPETPRKTEQMKKSGGIKLFSDLAGKTNGGHMSFFYTLENRIKDLREVPTVDESDIFLVFAVLLFLDMTLI